MAMLVCEKNRIMKVPFTEDNIMGVYLHNYACLQGFVNNNIAKQLY